MASQTSIIDIQVNDSAFQTYLASVREYRDLLKESGAELQKALDEVDSGSGQNRALKEELRTRKAIAKASRDATFEENRGEDAENRQNTRLRDRIRLTLEAGRHQRENINAAMKFAKSPIGRLGIAGAAAAGLVKALNAAGSLAQQGTDLRTQARMAGMDAGHYTAWQRNLEPYDPNGALLQHAVEATRDGAEAARLQAIGVDTSSNDPSKILASLVPALRQFRNAHQGPAERQVFEGMQLGDLVETADLLGRTGADEVNAIPGTVEHNARRNQVSDDVLRRHQEASLNVGRRHDEWTATKLNTLAPVVAGMTQGAEKAQEHLDDLALSAAKAAGNLDSLTGGNGALVGGIAAALGPSLLKGVGLKALPKLGGALLGRSVASPLLRMAGPAGAIIAGLIPHELGTDDTFDMAHRNPGSIRRATAPSITSDADLDRLTGAVAMAESHGDPNAVSPAGAQGLLQTMPKTFHSLGGTNPFDPRQSWQIGRKYLRQLLDRYHDTEKALAAYNWGPGNLDADIRQRGDRWRDGLKKETRDYIPRVMNNLQNSTIIRIENYSGQDLSVAARQGAVL